MASETAEVAQLATLGAPSLALGGQPIALQPLPLTLLAYLALEGPKPRRHLAELFWHHTDNGRNSLSSTLSRIRSACPDTIHATSSSVSVTLRTDLDDLDEAIERGETERVLSLYSGAFMSDASLRNLGPELEEWLLQRRDDVLSRVERSVLAGAEHAHHSGRSAEAAELAARLHRIASRDGMATPELLPRYARILDRARHPLGAEIKAEAAEFGIDLDPTDPPAQSSPAAAQMFGFEDERDRLRRSVAEHHIVQIIGLGGSGKTLLASDFFAAPGTSSTFEQRTWVDLSPITQPELVDATIAAAFGASLRPGQPLVDVVDASGPTLLVIDNFEQVADAITAVEALSAAKPHLRVVITSRIPVFTGSDPTVALDGLRTGDSDGPAQQLLRAAATRAGGSTDGFDHRTITEICELVGGLPLALELAGAWTRVLPPTHIAASLRRSAELLDGPPRTTQRAVSDIITDSVELLDEPQHHALRVLAAFPAGLDATQASTMLGLDLGVIAELTDRSVLTVDRDAGRLSVHPLVAQHFDGEKVDTPLLAWCQAFLGSVNSQSEQQAAGTTADLVHRVGRELANVASAWQRAARLGDWSVIDDGLGTLREFVVQSGRLVEGQHLLADVLVHARLPDVSLDLRLRLLEANGWVAYATGQTARARTVLVEAHELITAATVSDATLALIWRLDGTVAVVEGDVAAASACFERAQSLTGPSTPLGFRARLAVDLGRCHEASGTVPLAQEQYRMALDLGRAGEDPQVVALAYFFLASLEQSTNPKRCLVLLEEGRLVSHEHGLDHLSTYFPILGGHAFLNLGDPEQAEHQFRDGLALSESVGLRLSVAANHIGIAEALVASGTDDSAAPTAAAEAGIRVSIETRCLPYLVWAAYVVADLLLRRGTEHPEVAQLLERASQHPVLASGLTGRAKQAVMRHGVEAAKAGDTTASAPYLDDVDQLGEHLLELLRFG